MSVRIELLLEYMKEYDKGNEIDLSEYFGAGLEPIFKYTCMTSFNELEKILKNANNEYSFISKYCIQTPYIGGNVYWIVKDGLITAAYDSWDEYFDVDGFFEELEDSYGEKFIFDTVQECKSRIQKNIAENIKARVAQSSTMRILREETLADNSVLLTISV